MKRSIIFILSLTLSLSLVLSASAVDLSGMSFEELLFLRDQLTAEIMSRPEWKEVTVPAGKYMIGEDIPAGSYSVTSTGLVSYLAVYYEAGKENNDYDEYYIVMENNPLGKVILKSGMIITISAQVIFSPVKGLGF